MTTDDTVVSLQVEVARGEGSPIWSAATLAWRLVEVAAAGGLTGVLMILVWLDPRPDLSTAATQPFFWIKAAYPAAVAGCAMVAAGRLARLRPGGFKALAAAGALAAALLAAGLVQASGMSAAALADLCGPTSAHCLGKIGLLAAPMLALVAAGLRNVDLERPAPTGFACGLFCGGVAATVNGLHCSQGTYAFVGLWFTLAMLLCGAVGAGAVKLLARRRRFLVAAE